MPAASSSIFISYAHGDSAFAERLEADLRQQEFSTWLDHHNLAVGQKWRRELQQAIDRSQFVLVVLSPEALASDFVEAEYGYALEEGKAVFPLYYRACKVPLDLRGIQWIDFQQSYEQGLEELLHALHQEDTTASSRTSSPEQQAEHPWNVPFARNPFFTGRGELLERLHEQLSHSQRAALTQSAALSGLGGIGKSQTAIEYAYRYRDEYSSVLWVRADSRETLITDYVAIARLLSLPGHDAQEQMQVVTTARSWLEQHEGWLLILDNADDLSLLLDFLPLEGKGHLLFTTRAQATGKLARSLSVEKLEIAEGMQLLLQRAKVLAEDEPLDTLSTDERKAAQQLVEELDGLPLALDQAGAYIEETGCSLSDYLALYQQRRLALLKRESSMPTDYPHTVANTWTLSFAQVEQADPAAADLLRLCAFLHPDAIPEAIITEGADQLGPHLHKVAVDPLRFNDAIQLLRRYSLVKRDPEARLLNLHRLVQVVLKESLDAEIQRLWAERAVRGVDAVFPQEEYASWERCELCLPHALLGAELIAQYDFSFPEAARLLHAAGRYLFNRRQYTQAEPLLKRALSLRQNILGPEHVDTASTLNRLAFVYVYNGNYLEAELLVQPVLASYEQALGSLHPEVAYTLYVLGDIYLQTGRFAQAEPLLQRALSIREHTLGPSHPDVASSLNDLASLYVYQGKYAQAELFYRRALTLYEKALGPEHPDTLTSLQNLAVLSYHQGEYAQAEALYQEALAIRERVLGPEHPDTLTSLQNLATLYSQQGEYAQAEALYQETMAAQERVLGPEHPDTLYSLLGLGRLCTLRGQYQKAEALLQRAHFLHERALGPENDWTLRALLYLADLYQAKHQDVEAESLYQQAFSGFERTVGPDHPRVAEALTGLGQIYTRQGSYTQAESLIERALTITERALGSDHPQAATVLDTMGHLTLMQGQEERAASFLQRALSIQEQALGSAHPAVAQTLYHLAELYEKQGEIEQARSFYRRALAIREEVLGPDHPDSIATREAIAGLDQALQEQMEKAITSRPPTAPPG